MPLPVPLVYNLMAIQSLVLTDVQSQPAGAVTLKVANSPGNYGAGQSAARHRCRDSVLADGKDLTANAQGARPATRAGVCRHGVAHRPAARGIGGRGDFDPAVAGSPHSRHSTSRRQIDSANASAGAKGSGVGPNE